MIFFLTFWVRADLYFRWDKDYLYFGVVSSDSDIRETNGYWEGDGIQFHLEAGDTISNGGFSDFCLTMGPEEYVNQTASVMGVFTSMALAVLLALIGSSS